MQAAAAEALKEAQDHEDALSKARIVEERLQQRLGQLDEQLQVRHPTPCTALQHPAPSQQHTQPVLHYAIVTAHAIQ